MNKLTNHVKENPISPGKTKDQLAKEFAENFYRKLRR